MKHVSFMWLLWTVVIVGCTHTQTNETASAKRFVPITILHTNDVHGHAWAEKNRSGELRGGFAAQAKLVQQIWEEVDAKGGITLILSAGDVNTGTAESDLLEGEPDIVAMNHIGYDAMVLGNHEFDRGVKKIIKQKQIAKFPFLSANVYDAKDHYLTDPYVVLVRDNLRIGILGITTGLLDKLVLKSHIKDLKVEPPVASAKKHIPELEEMGAEIIIGLTHVGITPEESRLRSPNSADDRRLATKVPELDVIVGGHSHTLLEKPVVVDGTVIVQAGSHGHHLGRLDLVWDRKKKKIAQWSAKTIAVRPSDGEDPVLKKTLAKYKQKTKPLLSRRVAIALDRLDGERIHLRRRETNLGNLVTDILRKKAGADIAVMNSGGIRGSIAKGAITMSDVYRILPFGNTLVTATIDGATLKAALEHGLRHDYPGGALLQVSGFTYRANKEQVTEIYFKGKPVKPTDTLKMATNNFILDGGDGFDMFVNLPNKRDTALPLDRIFAEYLKKTRRVNPTVEKRILREDSQSISNRPSYLAE